MTAAQDEGATPACPECGAWLPDGGQCKEHFYRLLALEQELPSHETSGGRGEVAHYYAVSAYVLQHPDTMRYTPEALAGARENLAAHLARRVTLRDVRLLVRRASDGAGRITRRPGEAAVRWPVTWWPMTITDVLAGGVEGYTGRVTAWAASVIRTLDASAPAAVKAVSTERNRR